jgi:hypothetical protein
MTCLIESMAACISKPDRDYGVQSFRIDYLQAASGACCFSSRRLTGEMKRLPDKPDRQGGGRRPRLVKELEGAGCRMPAFMRRGFHGIALEEAILSGCKP